MKDNVEKCDQIRSLVGVEVKLSTIMEAHVIPALWGLRQNITTHQSELALQNEILLKSKIKIKVAVSQVQSGG